MKQTGLNGYVYDLLVNFASIKIGDLLKKTQYKIMFKFIKKMYIGLLSSCTTVSFGKSLSSNFEERQKCVSLNNQPSQARPALVDINSA